MDYEEKAWDMVMDEMKALRKDVGDIKDKINWVYGAVAVLTLVFNVGWILLKEKISRLW